MTIPIVFEKALSPDIVLEKASGTKQTTTIVVLEAGGPEDAAVYAAAVTAQTLILDGVPLVRSSVKPRAISDYQFEVDIEYREEDDEKSKERPEPGTWRFQFSGQNGTATVKQSRRTIARYSRSEGSDPAPNLNGIIDWDGEKIKGVEIIVPSFEFAITAFYNPAAITMAQCLAWAEKRGFKNGDTWFGRPPGEWLYLGPDGSGDIPTVAGQRVKPIGIMHKYSFSPTLTDFQLSDEITIAKKKGHDYLWVRYRLIDDAAAVAVLPKPIHAYVEEMYDDMDFGPFFNFNGS